MGIIKNILNSRAVRNAVQQQQNGFSNSTQWIKGLTIDDYLGKNNNGKYDNFYDNVNRITTGASKYPIYYTVDDEIVEPQEGKFAYYLKNLNDSYPQKKVLEQIYTELITQGYSDLFFWRKDGTGESTYFEDRKLNEDDFRGITLVSGYDQSRFTKKDKESIVRIVYGASQSNVFMGYSPTQAAESWRKMQDEMGLHMTAFAKNAGMPIGQWVISASSPEEYVKIRDKLEGKMSGAKNAGKQLFSYRPSESKTAQIEWVQFTSRDVQDYTDQMEFAESKITKAFGVPGTIKGTNDSENYATANVSRRNFAEWTLEPLVGTVVEQLEFHLKKHFDIKGELHADVAIPELADEKLVKIQATKEEVELFDAKIAEGYTPESIVAAYDLPERFLLLERASQAAQGQNKAKKASNEVKKVSHSHEDRDEFLRQYQNELTDAQRDELENGFRDILRRHADNIIANGNTDAGKAIFEDEMLNHFTGQYAKLYNVSVDYVAEELAEIMEVVDVAELNLTDEELISADEEYRRRVQAFADSYAAEIEKYQADPIEVRSRKERDHIHMVTVTESEHTRIVSELRSWTKAQEEFPVRVFKTWNARPDACPECTALNDIQIDVTALFVNNPTDEVYEVQGGGAHPNCRCFVRYEMEQA